MPFNGSGVFVRTDGTFTGSNVWTQEKNAANLVTAAHFDTHDQDLAGGLNNTVTRDGQGSATILSIVATVNSTTGVINIGGVNFANTLNGTFVGNSGNFTGAGTGNVGLGNLALANLTVGGSNTGIGTQAGQALTSAANSTLVGFRAGLLTQSGGGNVVVGANSLNTNLTGFTNTVIGTGAGQTATGSGNILIGVVEPTVAAGNNQLNLGCTMFGTGVGTTSGSTPGTGKIGINNNAPTYTFDVLTGNVGVGTTGFGLRVKEGSNCKQGTATLSSGTVTVANTSVTTSSRILISGGALNASTAIGMLSVPTITGATSFVITSYIPGGTATQTGDLRTVNYEIFEPY